MALHRFTSPVAVAWAEKPEGPIFLWVVFVVSFLVCVFLGLKILMHIGSCFCELLGMFCFCLSFSRVCLGIFFAFLVISS